MSNYRLLVGDVRRVLESLPERSVQLCMTSPPYWALRSYLPADHPDKALEMGSEPTPEAYVAGQVEVFRAVRRVLRDDGVLVGNWGDSYAASGMGGNPAEFEHRKQATNEGSLIAGRRAPAGLKPKDLVGIPWRVALALQADGWYLRSAMPWVKRSAMPSSVTDRPASALEYVFLLSKSPRYYFDMEAVKVALTTPPHAPNWARSMSDRNDRQVDNESNVRNWGDESGRNYRDTELWFASIKGPHGLCGVDDELVGLDVTAEPSGEDHFAAYPSRLVEPFVKACTSEKGCCPACGAGWRRILERAQLGKAFSDTKFTSEHQGGPLSGSRQAYRANGMEGPPPPKMLGWAAGCDCPAHKPVPCLVLDPFSGTGTTGVVATRHGRDYIGIDLDDKCRRIAERRIARALRPNTARTDDVGEAELFAGEGA